ncbi:hypothetical protein F4775DRAFT_559154 [Biscogniauxia sp. FL1348]|nr:hypothetical protein F4775DRAFT_559154 [Biscogniauxia sp. FL1348]
MDTGNPRPSGFAGTMATSTADAIVVDRTYFETLLRRADSNPQGNPANVYLAAPSQTVPVPKGEYDHLLLTARQYANLKQNLINGGVDEKTIQLLSQDDASASQVGANSTAMTSYQREQIGNGGGHLNPTSEQSHYGVRYSSKVPHESQMTEGHGNGTYIHGELGSRQAERRQNWTGPDPTSGDNPPIYSADGPAPKMNNEHTFGPPGNASRPHYARICRRTVSLSGLPDNVTHWDITTVVRGGPLLEIFVRASEHLAYVSFLLEDDAVRFCDHARKNDIYIKNKRILVRWADRQFHLAGHVAGKIVAGATRNLIIRRCDPRHTEESIRDDLEHINNLVVIKIDFIGNSCFIKTNSVHNAIFAQLCMMSRAKYKGSKIEWDVDECNQPIETIQQPTQKPTQPTTQKTTQKTPPKPQHVLPAKKTIDLQNRFDTLRIDDEDDEVDDKFDTSSELPSTVNVSA